MVLRSGDPAYLAALAFLLHAPGLRVVAGYRLDPRAVRINLVAVGATLVAMICAASISQRPMLAAFEAWLVGHFAWSAWLARHVFRRD